VLSVEPLLVLTPHLTAVQQLHCSHCTTHTRAAVPDSHVCPAFALSPMHVSTESCHVPCAPRSDVPPTLHCRLTFHQYAHIHLVPLPCPMCPVQAAVKQQILLSPSSAYRGYQPLGTNVTRHEAGFTPDWHEALDYFRWGVNLVCVGGWEAEESGQGTL
jgi:hypothetical protein